MKKILLLVLFCMATNFTKGGTVYGAEITYSKISDFTFRINLSVYIYNATADWDSLPIIYGDGTQDKIAKTSEIVIDSNLISKLDYEVVHTYPGTGTYVISFQLPKRPDGILNINGGNSINEPFYIEDALFLHDPNLLPFDYTPAFAHFQTEVTYDGTSLVHNGRLINPDADSVTYELIVPSSVTNYVFPNEFGGTSGTFAINDTGLVVWTGPQFPGNYCIAIKATLWKYGMKMGTIIRDMIIVVNVISAVDEISANGISMQLFPNPATSDIQLNLTHGLSAFVTIWNWNGEKVMQQNVSDFNPSIDISRLSPGLYFVKINDSAIGKFIKQ